MECTHIQEMRDEWLFFQVPPGTPFCADPDPHAPHEDCLGIMCDYGCNAEDF